MRLINKYVLWIKKNKYYFIDRLMMLQVNHKKYLDV